MTGLPPEPLSEPLSEPLTSHPASARRLTALASRWAGKTVGLYGGSFNPAHDGHRHVATEALKRLKLDAVWFLVSPGNPLKSDSEMAPFAARCASAQELADRHPRLVVSTLEAQIDSHYTAKTIALFVRLLPRTRFVWMMGADNLRQIDQWYRWQDIMALVPVAVFDRPGFSLSGLASPMARRFARARTPPPRLLNHPLPRWSFVRIPRRRVSATEIRRRRSINAWSLFTSCKKI